MAVIAAAVVSGSILAALGTYGLYKKLRKVKAEAKDEEEEEYASK